jgi:hypothetical protein
VRAGDLRRAVGEHDRRGRVRQPPGDEHEGVDCRLIRPVRVLDDKNGRTGWSAEFVEHRPLCFARQRAVQRLREGRIDLRRDVAQRTERERGHEVVTRADEHACPRPSRRRHRPHEGGLAHTGLACHEDDATATGSRVGDGLVEHGQRALPLE